jgi:hypothetical protein
MLQELAETIGQEVNEWCNDETPLEECIETSKKILEWRHSDNGYELAREFEDEGFQPDAELVEILEGVAYQKHQIVDDFVKKWVVDNDLKLNLNEGQKVIVKFFRQGEVEGEIVKLYPKTMQYGFWHVNHAYPKEKGHLIIDAEEIVSVVEQPLGEENNNPQTN